MVTGKNPAGEAVQFTTLETIAEVLRSNPVMDTVKKNPIVGQVVNWEELLRSGP